MEKNLTFLEHLEELRRRMIVSFITLVICAGASFPLSKAGLRILKRPAEQTIEKLVFFSPQEGFMIYIRISFLIGIILALPVILYQVWSFISPALKEKTGRYLLSFTFCGTFSFIAGIVFVYFLLLPRGLWFLLSFASAELEPVISATRYISFVTSLLVAGGIIFQMPVFSFLLTKIGMINWRFLKNRFSHAVVVIFILAAVITPTTDIFNLLLLGIPMIFLYGISIAVSFIAQPKRGYNHENKAIQNI